MRRLRGAISSLIGGGGARSCTDDVSCGTLCNQVGMWRRHLLDCFTPDPEPRVPDLCAHALCEEEFLAVQGLEACAPATDEGKSFCEQTAQCPESGPPIILGREGLAAATVAAALWPDGNGPHADRSRKVVAILSGGNVSPKTLAELEQTASRT